MTHCSPKLVRLEPMAISAAFQVCAILLVGLIFAVSPDCLLAQPLAMSDVACRTCVMADADQTVELVKNRYKHTRIFRVRPQDEVWVISARECSGCSDRSCLKVEQLVDSQFHCRTLDALVNAHQTDRSRSTLLYVHGNLTDRQFGVARGVQFYETLFNGDDDLCPAPPVRMVLWLWKSEKELKRLYSDYLIKSRRSVEMSGPLSCTIEALGDCRMTVIGFSLGTQVVISALETLEARGACRMSPGGLKLGFIAPAVDPEFACRTSKTPTGSSVAERSTVFFNRHDRALRALRSIVWRECPDAHIRLPDLILSGRLPVGQTTLTDVTSQTCGKHSIKLYAGSETIRRDIHSMVRQVIDERVADAGS